MTYPFVQAAFDYGPRKAPVLGFVVHMAEGGGTVGFLSRDPARGVSVHYVIEYSGRIVQMLLEAHASGSINPMEIRTTDDPDGVFGFSTASAVLGGWVRDPNSAVISVEIEGFAADGPNDAQTIALQALCVDVRSRHASIGLLGHRDFQSVKACPGRRIPWALIGGHGPANGGDMGLHVTFPAGPVIAGDLSIPKDTEAIRVADGVHYAVPVAVSRPAAAANLTGPNSGAGYLVDLNGDELHFIRTSPALTLVTPPLAEPDCAQAISDARAAGRESFRADVVNLP